MKCEVLYRQKVLKVGGTRTCGPQGPKCGLPSSFCHLC